LSLHTTISIALQPNLSNITPSHKVSLCYQHMIDIHMKIIVLYAHC
jgi:hypothetical protein